MSTLRVKMLQMNHVSNLANRWPQFAYLPTHPFALTSQTEWQRNGTTFHDIQVMVAGKSGYGKSTTLNRLVGEKIFQTSDVEACTKTLQSVEYEFKPEVYFSFNDLPGIGEAVDKDDTYRALYARMFVKSACVLYLLRADQRDLTVDLDCFRRMFPKKVLPRVIIGINCADKVSPTNRSLTLSQAQLDNLAAKRAEVSRAFGVTPSQVVSYSADTGYNFETLVTAVAETVKRCG